MTILTHQEILRAVESGEICIDPFIPELVKRNSVLLRLGTSFRRLSGDETIDVGDPESMARAKGVREDGYDVVVNDRSLVLAPSFERFSLAPDLMGVLSGISNVARLGVLVHATSAYVNAGFGNGDPSTVIFELGTLGGRSVRLRSGIPICHMAIHRLNEPVDFKRSARTGQQEPGASDLFAQFGQFIISPDSVVDFDASAS